jgi:hypothetical protein
MSRRSFMLRTVGAGLCLIGWVSCGPIWPNTVRRERISRVPSWWNDEGLAMPLYAQWLETPYAYGDSP